MYVNVAVLKETQPHERRVALTPSVAPKLIKLGARLHMQTGAADSIGLGEAAFPDVAFIPDRSELVADADVALGIVANDAVNPAARTDKSSPIFGMPILNADKAKQVYVVKRGQGKGYAGIVNALFYGDNCNMVYGDAAAVLTRMIEAVPGLGSKAAA